MPIKQKVAVIIIALFVGTIAGLLVLLKSTEKPNPKTPPISSLKAYHHPLIPSITGADYPVVNSQSYILIDVETNTILLSKNIHQKIYPASVTKLVTAFTALNTYLLNEVITIDTEYVDGKVMGLQVGEKITVGNLVSGLLIHSANDAAFNLASHYSTGTLAFIAEMNQLMKKYNLNDTHFVNFDGIHDTNHYSSAYDLSQIARLAIKNEFIRNIVKINKLTVFDIDKKIPHDLATTDELLGVAPEVEGLKTGWTPEAGGSFVGLLNINGHKLVSVVAMTEDRFGETKKIIDWAKSSIAWKEYSTN